jgi:hypothetical protein
MMINNEQTYPKMASAEGAISTFGMWEVRSFPKKEKQAVSKRKDFHHFHFWKYII